MKLKQFWQIFLKISILTVTFFVFLLVFYVKLLPLAVSSPKLANYIQNSVKKSFNADLTIKNPVLNTHFSPDIEFKIEKIYLTKENNKLIDLDNFNTELSLKEIFAKKIIVKKFVAENLYADVDGVQAILPEVPKNSKKNKSNFNIDIYEALLGVKNCEILYSLTPDTILQFKGEHIGVNNAEKDKRNVYFQMLADISKKGKHVVLKLNDNGNVFFQDNHFYIENCPLSINKSNIFINLKADRKQNFDINLFSKNFNINDIIDLLNSQIVENNVNESLVYFNDIKGFADFNLNIKNDALNGQFKLNKAEFKVKDVDNVPIVLTNGIINLTPTEVKLIDFKGYYDNDIKNELSFEGVVKDYLKTMDTEIVGKALARNDFFKTHLSEICGTPLEIKGDAPTRITLKSKNNIMDFKWLFMLKPGQNIKVADNFLPFEDSLRFMSADMHLENMVLDIKSLDYHMVPADKILSREEYAQKREAGEKFTPVFSMKSSVDIAHNNYIKFIGFEIPQPLPSELLNAVMGQEIFKRGQIAGNLTVDNKGNFPVLNGELSMEKVIIPIQKMFVKKAVLSTKNNLVHIDADGGYRRAKFNFNGNILNEIKFPVVIKDVNLSLENLDVYNMLQGFNNQYNSENVVNTDEGLVSVESSGEEFDIRNFIIENCHFHLDKGVYKNVDFANLDADLTLDKNGVVEIKSNRFDIAQGTSSLRANFDLINKKYNVKLGILDVESDLLADAILDLKHEISGKASGFLNLTADEFMKLNGTIKFKVMNGAIEKIGFVEYILKCASLFRNTITMINPGTIADIVNVPDGKFDKITGELELDNNVVTDIKIKTFSPDLSNYISGRYNIDNGDTSLRVYTKFSNVKKGFTGFLRKISLNSLANRITTNSRNDANYYAVELAELPEIAADEKDCQIFLTRVEGDVVNNNYISSLKKIK